MISGLISEYCCACKQDSLILENKDTNRGHSHGVTAINIQERYLAVAMLHYFASLRYISMHTYIYVTNIYN